jgi:threonylcarbamoyladenosine tRNA methylthiotransferase MtaB
MSIFSVTSLGCKVNSTEGLSLAETLLQRQWTRAGKDETPDLIVLNTCCVTTVAMRKSRQALRRLIRNAPHAAVCVAGCYSTYHRDALREILSELGLCEQQTLVVGHHDDVASQVDAFLQRIANAPGTAEGSPNRCDDRRESESPATLKARRAQAVGSAGTTHLPDYSIDPSHQRAFVKIQDGCDAFCSYCIVTYTRPALYSKPASDILDQCKRLNDTGHREIVLCGIFLGAYGRSTSIRKNWTHPTADPLSELVEQIADLPGLWRVRLSSLEPLDLTDRLLRLASEHPVVAPHFHLPLQSGSTEILHRMNRQYTAEQFCEAADRLNETLDRPALTTDVIVGFPGESDDDFAQTMAVARRAGFAKIHIFPLSPIEPTLAYARRNEMPPREVIQDRIAQLRIVEAELAATYRSQFVGTTTQALVESVKAGQAKLMTDRYLTINTPLPKKTIAPSDLVTARITEVTDSGLRGEICE